MSQLLSGAVETRRRRILFVEDQTDLLAAYERAFRHHEIVLAGTGGLAIHTIQTQPDLDLVVCDLVLPDIDGIEVYHRAAAISETVARRFVFATGNATRPDLLELIEKLRVPLLSKPFGMSALRAMLEQMTIGRVTKS